MEFGRKLAIGRDDKPEWLKDEDVILPKWDTGWSGLEDGATWGSCIHTNFTAIRLPADHFASKAMDAGFEPWGGGDESPADWDGGDVMYRDGTIHPGSPYYRWVHSGSGNAFSRDADIIGYRKRTEPNDETKEAMAEIQNGEVERFETVGELMENLNKEYLVQNVAYSGYTVGKVYEHVVGSHDVYDDDGDCRHYFEDNFRLATTAEIAAYIRPEEWVRVKRMTRDEAQKKFEWCDGIDVIERLGILREETSLEKFEREHGGLDNNQRDIVEAYQNWLDSQN